MEKILIVDDELGMLDFLDYMLTKEGYDVSRASEGRKAIEMLQLSLIHI